MTHFLLYFILINLGPSLFFKYATLFMKTKWSHSYCSPMKRGSSPCAETLHSCLLSYEMDINIYIFKNKGIVFKLNYKIAQAFQNSTRFMAY